MPTKGYFRRNTPSQKLFRMKQNQTCSPQPGRCLRSPKSLMPWTGRSGFRTYTLSWMGFCHLRFDICVITYRIWNLTLPSLFSKTQLTQEKKSSSTSLHLVFVFWISRRIELPSLLCYPLMRDYIAGRAGFNGLVAHPHSRGSRGAWPLGLDPWMNCLPGMPWGDGMALWNGDGNWDWDGNTARRDMEECPDRASQDILFLEYLPLVILLHWDCYDTLPWFTLFTC